MPDEPDILESISPVELSVQQYTESFGEELAQTLRLENWHPGIDLGQEYQRIQEEVEIAVAKEDEIQKRLRKDVFPALQWYGQSPECAGVYQVTLDEIEKCHRGLLFNGGVEACDGTSQIHDTLPLTIHQIGVSLVSYSGNQGTWSQRLFRKDLGMKNPDPVEEALALLERRAQRPGLNQISPRDALSELAQRAIMSYAERAILLHESSAVWRMGHGSPAPLELLVGGGFAADLIIESIRVMRAMIEDHQRFVYVASEPGDRLLLTLGQALRPLEYVIARTAREVIAPPLEQWSCSEEPTVDTTWDGEDLTVAQWVARFRDEVAPRVIVGAYRASAIAPAQIFYAHEDHVHVAARIAIADSVLQEQRGFPLLIDLADRNCSSVYGGGSLKQIANLAYAEAGVPFQYQSERDTRTTGGF